MRCPAPLRKKEKRKAQTAGERGGKKKTTIEESYSEMGGSSLKGRKKRGESCGGNVGEVNHDRGGEEAI